MSIRPEQSAFCTWIGRLIALAGSLLLGTALAQPTLAFAEESVRQAEPIGSVVGVPWVGEFGITESMEQIMARDALFPANARALKPYYSANNANLPQDSSALAVPRWPFDGNWSTATSSGYPSLIERHVSPFDELMLPQSLSTNFLGATLNESGYIPPDTMGEVGPSQIFVTLNGRFKLFNKTGSLAFTVSSDSFFTSVRNGSGTSDPRVVYDKISQRWFVVMINVASASNRVLIAVSNGPTLTNTASFTFYQFTQDATGGGVADNGAFADYPSLGVDANALYIGCNMFNPGYYGTTGWVVRKSSVLSGGPIVVTTFRGMATSGGEGPYAPRGVTNGDPAATEGYFVGVSNISLSRLTFRRISTPGGTPTISSNIILGVPTTAQPVTIPAQGSTLNVQASDHRLYDARIYRNRSTGARTLWTAHCIQVNAAGTATSAGGRDGGRWYQIQNLTTVPSLVQAGTLFDSAASNPKYYNYPTAAMSGQGHMAIGASFGGAVNFMSAAAAGRLSSDALGSTQAPTVIINGASSYTLSDGSRNRWGDYSSTSVDPSDDQTIWTFQEYVSATDTWAVRVAKLLAPPPATPSSIVPNSLVQGASNVNLTVTGTSASGSAFYDTEPGYNRLVAAFSGLGITVNSALFNSGTSLTLNVSVSGGAAAGLRNLTVTNPDGQTATGINLLTIKISCPADLNGDGQVDDSDFVIFASAYDIFDCADPMMPAGCPADLNGDGFVEDADFVLFASAYDAFFCP